MKTVSIIIPVYNVEDYLRRCIDSVLRQTYENIELILVNDGSTDGSGAIIDSYAIKDPRVKVIHKKNSGSSDSRNMGLDISSGELIMYVDSDDYIDHRIVSHLCYLMRDNIDITACGYTVVREEVVSHKEYRTSGYTREFNAEQALQDMMYVKSLTNNPWGKLIRRSMLDGIQFPSGKINQDLGTMYKVFANARKVSISSEKFYNYMQREGSVINSNFSIKRMAGLEFASEQLSFAKENFPGIEKAAINRLFAEAFNIYVKICDSQNSAEFKPQIDKSWSVVKKYRNVVIFDSDSTAKVRVGAALTYSGKKMTYKLARLVKTRIYKKI